MKTIFWSAFGTGKTSDAEATLHAKSTDAAQIAAAAKELAAIKYKIRLNARGKVKAAIVTRANSLGLDVHNLAGIVTWIKKSTAEGTDTTDEAADTRRTQLVDLFDKIVYGKDAAAGSKKAMEKEIMKSENLVYAPRRPAEQNLRVGCVEALITQQVNQTTARLRDSLKSFARVDVKHRRTNSMKASNDGAAEGAAAGVGKRKRDRKRVDVVTVYGNTGETITETVSECGNNAEVKTEKQQVSPMTSPAGGASDAKIQDLKRQLAAAEKAAEEKCAKEKAAQDKVAEEKAAEEKAAAEKEAEEKAAQDKVADEKAADENAAKEKAAAEKVAEEKAADEKEAEEKAAQDKVAEEKAADAKKQAAEKEAGEENADEDKAATENSAEKSRQQAPEMIICENNGSGQGGLLMRYEQQGVTDDVDFFQSRTCSALEIKGIHGGRNRLLFKIAGGVQAAIPTFNNGDEVVIEFLGHFDYNDLCLNGSLFTYPIADLKCPGRFDVDTDKIKSYDFDVYDIGKCTAVRKHVEVNANVRRVADGFQLPTIPSPLYHCMSFAFVAAFLGSF